VRALISPYSLKPVKNRWVLEVRAETDIPVPMSGFRDRADALRPHSERQRIAKGGRQLAQEN
jgi:hypothetical protein